MIFYKRSGLKKVWKSAALFLFFLSTSAYGVDISDDPMETKMEAAPPNIMFILDNSGSMNWEFMTSENNGTFSIGETAHEYLFPDPGDNVYASGNDNGTVLENDDKAYWKSQWSGYNKLYYNPHSRYTPWPGTSTYTTNDADLRTPYSNPIHNSDTDPSITLSGEFVTIGDVTVIMDSADAGSATYSGSSVWLIINDDTAYNGTFNGISNSSLLGFCTDCAATITPQITVPGDYRVYIWRPNNSSLNENAKITVNYNNGTSSEANYIQQYSDTSDGEWHQVGDKTYNFSNLETDNVVIENHSWSKNDSSPYAFYTIFDAVKFQPATDAIIITNAHYYTWYDANDNDTVDNQEVYLVTWEDTDDDGDLDQRVYYQLNDSDNDNIVEKNELTAVTYSPTDPANDDVPNGIQPKNYEEDGITFTYKTDEEDLQNFANWYSYYRRRQLAAKAAIAKSIQGLGQVYAGFYTINTGLRQTVLPVNLESNSVIVDNEDSGFTTSETWNESRADDYGQEYNGSSLYVYNGAAQWTPNLSAGTYNVYSWWGYVPGRTTAAQYTIYHNSGISTVEKDHTVLADAFEWQLLGTYNFNEGTDGYVTVQNAGSSSDAVSADAIKFEDTSGDETSDNTAALLDLLYEMNEDDSDTENTPLRSALRDVGRYYDQDDGESGNLGDSPFMTEEDGGACQQAFAIMVTDGYYNGSDPGIGNEDGDDGSPYADNYADTLADMAMKYYDTDLSNTLSDNVPTNPYDNKNAQHMITYSVSFGTTGTIDPTDIDGDGITDDPAYEDDPYFLNSETKVPVWPDPDAGDAEKIDDLWHAAVNGRGQFPSADDPAELVSSLNAVFETLTSKAASGASVSVNANQLSAGSVMYQSSYTSDNWEGDVIAYPINSTTGDILTAESDILWQASERLQLQDWDTERRIVTYDGHDSILSFRYDNLTSIQKTAIGNNSNVVDYIRGQEVSGFRSRDQKLGDIVHSAPLFVIGDSVDNNENGAIDEDDEENGIIFAGANDGMLHAFDAETGDEIFAYIPNLVFDHLDDLTSLTYDHKFYVDATPFSKTVTIDGDTMVLLTGGLKKGGKGYYCLDITRILYQDTAYLSEIGLNFSEEELATPSHQDSVDVMWEYPSVTSGSDGAFGTTDDEFGSDDDLGYSFSDIFIVESYKDDNPPGDHNWIAVFGNGYDSVNGSAVLYVLNAHTGEMIRKIDTGVSGDNGLSSPALIDMDNDGKVDYAYAGDLKGNMWKFDLKDNSARNWKVSYLETNGVKPAPLFTSANQPITSAPDVMNHCASDSGYIVLFGTGKFMGESDRTNIDQQTIYGLWDLGYPLGEWNESSGTLSRMDGATLLEQTQIDFQSSDETYLRTLSDNSVTWVELNTSGDVTSGTHIGWYFDLPMDLNSDAVLDGERVIRDVLIRDGNLIAITFTPGDTPCTAGGLSMVMEMNACIGSRLDDAQLDINNDSVINKDDFITITDPDDPTDTITVAPTGIGYSGLLSLPAIVTMPDSKTEMKIFSSSEGTTEQLFETAEGGFYYWIQIKN